MRGGHNICTILQYHCDDNYLFYMTLLLSNGTTVVVVAKMLNQREVQGGCPSIRWEKMLQRSGLHCRGAVEERQVRKTSNVKSWRKISINI